MLLAWNTLQEASEYLAEETQKIWNEREVLQACLSFGIFPKLQILARDRNDIPSWMIEGEMAELPFNLDLLSFLAGDGRVKLVRYDGLLYRFTPSLLVGIERLRLSRDDLANLLNDICEKKYNVDHLQKKFNPGNLPEEIQSHTDYDAELADLFDPVPYTVLSKMFPCASKKGNDNWERWHRRSKECKLYIAKEGRGRYNPYKAAKWLIDTQKPKNLDWAKCLRVLGNNLPVRSIDSKHLFLDYN